MTTPRPSAAWKPKDDSVKAAWMTVIRLMIHRATAESGTRIQAGEKPALVMITAMAITLVTATARARMKPTMPVRNTAIRTPSTTATSPPRKKLAARLGLVLEDSSDRLQGGLRSREPGVGVAGSSSAWQTCPG
jgi:hypothetical protein